MPLAQTIYFLPYHTIAVWFMLLMGRTWYMFAMEIIMVLSYIRLDCDSRQSKGWCMNCIFPLIALESTVTDKHILSHISSSTSSLLPETIHLLLADASSNYWPSLCCLSYSGPWEWGKWSEALSIPHPLAPGRIRKQVAPLTPVHLDARSG